MKAGALAMRLARVSEREALEQLQRRSSMHEPMYRAQLAAHPDAVELPAEQITEGLVRVAEQNGAIVGCAVLVERSADACELDGLFVEPERMRAGVGRRLVEDAKRIARERGATRIDVVANPQAVALYESVGFTTVGEARTRFDGQGFDDNGSELRGIAVPCVLKSVAVRSRCRDDGVAQGHAADPDWRVPRGRAAKPPVA